MPPWRHWWGESKRLLLSVYVVCVCSMRLIYFRLSLFIYSLFDPIVDVAVAVVAAAAAAAVCSHCTATYPWA
jgi:hypothetical protein